MQRRPTSTRLEARGLGGFMSRWRHRFGSDEAKSPWCAGGCGPTIFCGRRRDSMDSDSFALRVAVFRRDVV